MANTLGYITGALSGLALLCGLSYSIENPQRALVPFNDTISSVERTLIKPEGYIGEGNLFEGLEDTPYQSQRLSSAHYRNSRDLAEHLNDELQEKERVIGITKGDLTLAGTGLGLGIVAVLGYANRKRP